MQKVTEYKLVTAISPQVLEVSVNGEMKHGWVPSGTVVSYSDMLVQAMVKFETA